MATTPSNGVRKRAVRLTDKGLDVLTEALCVACEASSSEKRLTREERARLLDVSVVTAQRILSGQGVDRGSLKAAFDSLGVPWKESYCEYGHQPAVADLGIKDLPRLAVPITSAQPIAAARKTHLPWIGICAGLAASMAVVPLFVTRPQTATTASAKTRDTLVQDLVDKATAHYNSGEYELARKEIAAAETDARALKNAPILGNALIIDGQLEVVRGDYYRARTLYSQAIELRRTMEQPANIPPLLESLADVELHQGLLQDARQHLLECKDGYEHERDMTGVALTERDLGSLATESGNLDEAGQWFLSALGRISDTDKPEIVMDIRARQALVLRYQGRFEEARSILVRTYTLWKRRHHTRWIAESLFERATVESVAGNDELASNLFQRSKILYEQVGDKPGMSKCDEWIAQVLAKHARSGMVTMSKGSKPTSD